jgi:hypothetical protein
MVDNSQEADTQDARLQAVCCGCATTATACAVCVGCCTTTTTTRCNTSAVGSQTRDAQLQTLLARASFVLRGLVLYRSMSLRLLVHFPICSLAVSTTTEHTALCTSPALANRIANRQSPVGAPQPSSSQMPGSRNITRHAALGTGCFSGGRGWSKTAQNAKPKSQKRLGSF